MNAQVGATVAPVAGKTHPAIAPSALRPALPHAQPTLPLSVAQALQLVQFDELLAVLSCKDKGHAS